MDNPLSKLLLCALDMFAPLPREFNLTPNRGSEILWFKGLRHILVDSQLFSEADLLGVAQRCQEYKRKITPIRTLTNELVKTESINVRHHDVGENNIWAGESKRSERLLGTMGLDDLETL